MDEMIFRSNWTKKLIARVVMKALKAQGVNMVIEFNDLEATADDTYITAKVGATVKARREEIEKLLERM